MAVLLTDLTPNQLDQLISQATQRKKALKARKPVGTVRAQIIAAALAHGYTIDELFGSPQERMPKAAASKGPRAGFKVAPKFRNPENLEQTWSGRGMKPVWLRDALAKRGTKIEDFAI